MSLFDPSNNLFQDALWRCLISLAFLTVCGLTWEIIRATRTSRMRRGETLKLLPNINVMLDYFLFCQQVICQTSFIQWS